MNTDIMIKKLRNVAKEYKTSGTLTKESDVSTLCSEVADRLEELMNFKQYFSELYGQGLEIVNWHLNGDTEPFDNFYDSAEMAGTE